MTPSQYAKVLVTKTLWYGDVNEEYAFKEVFIEGLNSPIRHSMPDY